MKINLETNLIIRFILWPFISSYRFLRREIYLRSKDAEFISSLQDSHLNERCFIIGNGPSLRTEDLDALKDEFCFAFNGIYHIFDSTQWRPDIYMCVDKNILAESKDIFSTFQFSVLLAKQGLFSRHSVSNIFFIENYVPFYIRRYQCNRKLRFSSNPSFCVYGGGTVTYTAMQLAAYMGFKEIYLVGIDHSYSKFIDSNGHLIIDNSIKDYFGDIPTKSYTIQVKGVVEAAYTTALHYTERNGIKIFNATRGGKLEIFPRVNLDTVLESYEK